MSFAESIRKNVDKILQEIDTKMYAISTKLFKEVVYKCPVLRGNLINDFHVKANGYDTTSITASYVVDGQSSVGSNSDKEGKASLKQIASAIGFRTWYGKDGFLSMSNSVPYAYRIEFEGYSKKEKAPTGFIRNSLTKVASEVKQGTVI